MTTDMSKKKLNKAFHRAVKSGLVVDIPVAMQDVPDRHWHPTVEKRIQKPRPPTPTTLPSGWRPRDYTYEWFELSRKRNTYTVTPFKLDIATVKAPETRII